MQKVVEYSCAYCGKRFSAPEDCEQHEKTHMRDYNVESNEGIVKELRSVAERAWGYHIGHDVVGMPYYNFVSLMKAAADRIEGSGEDGNG